MLASLAFTASVNGQTNFVSIAGEYSVVGALVGDQMHGQAAYDAAGGWIVWQDNVTDGAGMGIGAQRLNSNLSSEFSAFRVNQQGAGEQEHPQVVNLQGGGAAVVWQSGRSGFQDIFIRYIKPNGTFLTGDILVNSYTNQYQVHPSMAALGNGNVVVAWVSYGQDGSQSGVYGQIFSGSGNKVGGEFRLSQTTELNQRTPSVAKLQSGGFVAVWSSEKRRIPTAGDARDIDVEVASRLFTDAGAAVGSEVVVTTQSGIAVNPVVASAQGSGFAVAWAQVDLITRSNSWDIFGRAYSSAGAPAGSPVRINADSLGDQSFPRIAAGLDGVFVVWTSLGQDGSFEGVYGRRLALTGVPTGTEMRINTTTLNKQMHPSVSVDGDGRFLAVWSGFTGQGSGFDLAAQRFGSNNATQLPTAPVPFVSAISSSSLGISWAPVAGYAVAFYEVHVEGLASPIVVNGFYHVLTNLPAGTSRTFRLQYQLADGRRSELSSAVTGVTWSADSNGDGLPDDWQAKYWGASSTQWPSATADSDNDGATNLHEFLAGTDPVNPDSVLRTWLTKTPQGGMFIWNTQPGCVYQLQGSVNLVSWQNIGTARFAHGDLDSVNVGQLNNQSFYRIIRLR